MGITHVVIRGRDAISNEALLEIQCVGGGSSSGRLRMHIWVTSRWSMGITWKKWPSLLFTNPFFFVCCYFCPMCLGFELILYGPEDDNLELINCRSGEWGDHVTLQAAADYVSFPLACIMHLYLFCRSVCTITVFLDGSIPQLNRN